MVSRRNGIPALVLVVSRRNCVLALMSVLSGRNGALGLMIVDLGENGAPVLMSWSVISNGLLELAQWHFCVYPAPHFVVMPRSGLYRHHQAGDAQADTANDSLKSAGTA